MALKNLKEMTCVSCGQGILVKGSAHFPCAMCGQELARCGDCREQSVAYRCAKCGHQGP